MIENAQKIDGWMTDEELGWIAHAAKYAKTIMEIGCYKGRSTRCWLDNTFGKVHVVDPWSSMGVMDNGEVDVHADFRVYNEFYNNLANFVNEEKLIIHRAVFSEATELPKADLIFIDGDHREEHVKQDIHKAMNLLNKPGVICGHDYGVEHWPAVKRVVDKVFPDAGIVGTIWFKEIT